MSDIVRQEADYSLWYWKLYYHLLLYLHIILGVAGVVIGAMIAADVTVGFFNIGSQGLGVISTVIVGIVSFVQPGRMASVFFDAYWRLRIAVLRSEDSPTANEDLIAALSNGYTSVATIQPEALQKHKDGNAVLDIHTLSADRREALVERLKELVAEEDAEAAAKKPEEASG